MGLSSFPSAAEGVLPVLVMNTVLSVALLKNMVRSLLQVVMGANYWILVQDYHQQDSDELSQENATRERRISTTQFKSSGAASATTSSIVECCVCLCGFEDEEEVSELACKHFFHKRCLEKWFDNYKHTTCPLCRSIL